MSRFICVMHRWFVDSEGFQIDFLKAKNSHDARNEADALTYQRDHTFSKAASFVIEIGDTEGVVSRNLTWRERFTGKINRSLAE